MKLCVLMIVAVFASYKDNEKSDIVKTEESLKGTDYVKVNTVYLEDILEFQKNGWENEDVHAFAHAAGTELSQILFEENLEDEEVRALLNYIEAKFSQLRFDKKMGYLDEILDFKVRYRNDILHPWDIFNRIGPEMINLYKAGGNYEDIDMSSILSEMEHLEEILEFRNHGWKNGQIVHNIGTEFINLLQSDGDYQGIFEALRADLDDWHKTKPNLNEFPFGKVFFINQTNGSYALYASGVTRKWTLFKFQHMIKWKTKNLSKSSLHGSLKLRMIQMFHKLGKWKKVMEDANVSLSLKKMTIYVENDDKTEKIEIERKFLPFERPKMMHEFDKIKKFKRATRINDKDLKKYTRAAYYEEDWYKPAYYELETVRYKKSTGKYEVTFKDDPSIKFQVHENELFAGDIDVGHEVIVKDAKDANEDRVGFVTEIVFKGVDPPKIWYDIEWEVPLDKMTNSMVKETDIVALYSTQKRKREPSPENRKLEQNFKN